MHHIDVLPGMFEVDAKCVENVSDLKVCLKFAKSGYMIVEFIPRLRDADLGKTLSKLRFYIEEIFTEYVLWKVLGILVIN